MGISLRADLTPERTTHDFVNKFTLCLGLATKQRALQPRRRGEGRRIGHTSEEELARVLHGLIKSSDSQVEFNGLTCQVAVWTAHHTPQDSEGHQRVRSPPLRLSREPPGT